MIADAKRIRHSAADQQSSRDASRTGSLLDARSIRHESRKIFGTSAPLYKPVGPKSILGWFLPILASPSESLLSLPTFLRTRFRRRSLKHVTEESHVSSTWPNCASRDFAAALISVAFR